MRPLHRLRTLIRGTTTRTAAKGAVAPAVAVPGHGGQRLDECQPRVDLCGLAELDTAISLLATALLRLIEHRERLADEVVLRMAMAGELAWVGEARG